MKKIIFLAGPMKGIPKDIALEWRKKAIEILSDNFDLVHAMRGREEKETFLDYKAAIARDKDDIIHSDIILVNDTFDNASMIGTSMEIIFAHELHKIIIIFGKAHESDYWLNYHCHTRLNSLEEACDYVNKLFK